MLCTPKRYSPESLRIADTRRLFEGVLSQSAVRLLCAVQQRGKRQLCVTWTKMGCGGSTVSNQLVAAKQEQAVSQALAAAQRELTAVKELAAKELATAKQEQAVSQALAVAHRELTAACGQQRSGRIATETGCRAADGRKTPVHNNTAV